MSIFYWGFILLLLTFSGFTAVAAAKTDQNKTTEFLRKKYLNNLLIFHENKNASANPAIA
jgi:hypothetical protein